MAGNPGEALLSGINAGQAIRGKYDAYKTGKEVQEVSKKYFEKLRSLGMEELPGAGAIPVPDGAGSEGMAANAAAANNMPVSALPVDGGAVQPKKKKTYRSATADDYTELDTMAARIATMTGDAKAYDALRGMTRSHVQTRIMDQMRKAQVALQVNDQEGLEDAIQRAYQFVPDSKELTLKRDKDGQLLFKHPTSGKDLPVNAESLRLFTMAALDPDAMEETMYGRKKQATEEGQKDRALDISQQNANVGAINAGTGVAAQAETARANRAEERRKAVNDKVDNLVKNTQAVQNLAYADYLGKGGKQGAAGKQPTMDDQRKFAKDVNDAARLYIMPMQKQEVTDDFGTKYIDAPAPRLPGFENADEATVNTVSSFAEQIGIANPSLGISQAVGAGATIYKALQGQGNISVDPNTGLLGIPIDGKMQVFRVPPEMIQTLLMRSQQAPAPGQGIPTQ